MDPRKVRATGLRAAPPAAAGSPASRRRHAGVAALRRDRERPAQAAAASGPQHQGTDQRSTDRGDLAASLGPARSLSAGGRGHDTAARLGGFLLFAFALTSC